MKYLKKAICLLLCFVSLFGIFAIFATASEEIPPFETPTNTKKYSARYEIIVDSWVCYDKATKEETVIISQEPYRVGPLDTTIHKLENGQGDYWLDQLALYGGIDVGFRMESMISFFIEKNGHDYICDSYLDGTYTEFHVNADGKNIYVPSLCMYNSYSGLYVTNGSGFQVSSVPSTIPFTASVETDVAYPNSGMKYVFYGTLKYTGIKDTNLSILQLIADFFNRILEWFKSIFNIF